MTWSTIRKSTGEDVERLNTAAARFEQRHGIHPDDLSRDTDLWDSRTRQTIYGPDVNHLIQLWHKCAARAVREIGAEGIAWGYVGYNVRA